MLNFGVAQSRHDFSDTFCKKPIITRLKNLLFHSLYHSRPGGPLIDNSASDAPVEASTYIYKREPIEPHHLNDPDIDALVAAYKKGTYVNTPRVADMPHKDRYLTVSTCMACHPAAVNRSA